MKTKTICFTCVLLLALLCGCGRLPTPAESTTAAAVTSADSAAPVTQDDVPTTGAPTTGAVESPSALQEAQLYADYLLNGGYAELLYSYDEPDAEFEAEAVLADVNEDGVRELLIHITDKSSAGVRGYSSVSVLLGVRDGKVECLGFADYGGGSGGGDYLHIRYDTQSGKHVLEYEEFVRDGMFFSTYALRFFDVSRRDPEEKQYGLTGAGNVVYKVAHTLRSRTFYEEGVYAEDAQRMLAETDLCKREDGFVTGYQYDDGYISEAEYDALCARFVEPTDPAYQMKPVTLDNPIPD